MKRAPKSAAKVVISHNSDYISSETEAIQGRIRQRAFERSHTRPPDAHELYDWIMAESEVISVPPVELIEKNRTCELRFAVAGVSPEDVNLVVTPDQILLKSEYSHQHEASVGEVHICDFKSATVFRSVDLPHAIDVNSVKVTTSSGMILVKASREGAGQARPPRSPAARKTPAKKTQAKAS